MLDREDIAIYALAKKLAQEPLPVIIRALLIAPSAARKALEMHLEKRRIYGASHIIAGWERRIQRLC